MDRVRAGGLGDAHERLDREVAFRRRGRADRIGLVGHQDVQRFAVDVGIDGDRRQAFFAAAADHAAGDLSAIGDEDLPHSGTAFAAASRKLVSTICLSGSTVLMKPCFCHHAICFSMSCTQSRPLRSWNGKPTLMIAGGAPTYFAVIATTSS